MTTFNMDTRWLTLACLGVSLLLVKGDDDPILDTTKGRVVGSMEGGVKRFVGIPYAKPPIGDLRFKHPVEPDPWTDTKEAKTLPNSCWQTLDESFGRFHGVEMWNPNTPRSEDCLYLNVWIPDTSSTNLPILVWIYGGGFWAGTSTLDVYDPTKLVAMQNMIVVSMNYRLGALGFIYSGTEEAPGNAGIMDQVMALKWVQANAASMGGDSSKITIMGESAGAASVGFHLLSDLSKPLFNNAVMMSASPYVKWGVQSHDKAKSRFKLLSDILGCDKSTYEAMVTCLRGVPASNITSEMWSVVDGTYLDTPFALISGDDFLPDSVHNLMKQKKIKDTSIMAGVVKDEGIFWLTYGFQDVFKRVDPNPVTEAQYEKVLEGIMAQTKYISSTVEDFTSFIYRDSHPPKSRPKNLDVLDDISGDTLFKCAVRNFAAEYSKVTTTDKTFVYSFNYRLSNNPWPEYFGVAHGYEIENFFGIPYLHSANYSDVDRAVSLMTMDYLSNFVNTGNPNSGAKTVTVQWPKFTSSSEDNLVFKENPVTDNGPRFSECKYWSMANELDEVSSTPSPNSACSMIPVVALIVLLCAMLVWSGSVLPC